MITDGKFLDAVDEFSRKFNIDLKDEFTLHVTANMEAELLKKRPDLIDRHAERLAMVATEFQQWKMKGHAAPSQGGATQTTEGKAEQPRVERDIARRRPAVQTQSQWDSEANAVGEESDYSSIIAKLARSRGQQRPRVHRLAGGHSEE